MSTILANATLVTMNPRGDVLNRASLLIEGDRIAAIGAVASLNAQAPEADVYDAALHGCVAF